MGRHATRTSLCREGLSACERDFRRMLTRKKGLWVQGKSCGIKLCELRMRGEGGSKSAEECPYCR